MKTHLEVSMQQYWHHIEETVQSLPISFNELFKVEPFVR